MGISGKTGEESKRTCISVNDMPFIVFVTIISSVPCHTVPPNATS